jgi:hypothetical protein
MKNGIDEDNEVENGPDRSWTEKQWKDFILKLMENDLISWRETASLILGALNPPQVGTAIASNKSFQKRFPKGKIWQNVREWLYAQPGPCEICGTRLDLQADHIEDRKTHGESADRLDNLRLICRRCNVVRRPSHKKGGLTFLTSQSALMWIMFVYHPKTYEEFKKGCRNYGLTMADIRFQEAWAMAIWLSRQRKYPLKD